jgi:hypothetical protein
MANGDVEPGIFALTLLHSGRNINDGIADIVNQIFLPMSRELRRYLIVLVDNPEINPSYVPASDRIVALHHNSDIYTKTLDDLDQLEASLQQVNDYPDVEDKSRNLPNCRQADGFYAPSASG